MAEQRRQRSRLEGYRQLAKLLEPFESVAEEVQQRDLVGTDGELRRELNRMRGLVARVTGRIGELRGRRGMDEREDEAMVVGEMDKLRHVMDVL